MPCKARRAVRGNWECMADFHVHEVLNTPLQRGRGHRIQWCHVRKPPLWMWLLGVVSGHRSKNPRSSVKPWGKTFVWPRGSSGKQVSHTGKAGLTKALFSMGGTEQWKGHSEEHPTCRLRRRQSLKTKPYPYPWTEVSIVVKMLSRGKVPDVGEKLFKAVEVGDSFKPLWKSSADSVLVMEQRTSSFSMQSYCRSHGSLCLSSLHVFCLLMSPRGPGAT